MMVTCMCPFLCFSYISCHPSWTPVVQRCHSVLCRKLAHQFTAMISKIVTNTFLRHPSLFLQAEGQEQVKRCKRGFSTPHKCMPHKRRGGGLPVSSLRAVAAPFNSPPASMLALLGTLPPCTSQSCTGVHANYRHIEKRSGQTPCPRKLGLPPHH